MGGTDYMTPVLGEGRRGLGTGEREGKHSRASSLERRGGAGWGLFGAGRHSRSFAPQQGRDIFEITSVRGTLLSVQ